MYEQGVNATVDGVLGGYADVNEPDITCSDDFLKIILSERFNADAKTQPLVALGTFFRFIFFFIILGILTDL